MSRPGQYAGEWGHLVGSVPRRMWTPGRASVQENEKGPGRAIIIENCISPVGARATLAMAVSQVRLDT